MVTRIPLRIDSLESLTAGADPSHDHDPETAPKVWAPAMDATQLVCQFFESVWNRGEFEEGVRLFTADFRHHDLVTGTETDLDGYFSSIRSLRERLDARFEVAEMVAQNERVASRWEAHASIGEDPPREIRINGMSIDHVRGARIAENWTVWDRFGLAAQAPGLIDS